MQVQAEVVIRDGHDPRVNEGRIDEPTTATLRVGVLIDIVALIDHTGDGHELAVVQRLLPRKFGHADAIDAGPDAGGIGDSAEVFPGVLVLPGGPEVGLGFDLAADPAGGAVSGRIVDGPVCFEVEGVITQVVVALHHIGHADKREGLLQRIAEAVTGEPILAALDDGFKGEYVKERAGAAAVLPNSSWLAR